MSDDEQGYAPAAYLEPMEGGRKQHNVEQQQMESENTVYEGECGTYVSSFLLFLPFIFNRCVQ